MSIRTSLFGNVAWITTRPFRGFERCSFFQGHRGNLCGNNESNGKIINKKRILNRGMVFNS